ncbi:hypothetical protein EJ08DRAFT_670506 [Tothia fuscella]|uniref:Uncharacterized protein n=1 Tax=Tothia fuscella TaxID=1048955 RepID=A0A9P4NRI4_9PEZI|nr:hypothetical protein EJ08DRAFT_670506 [Tothia fuscella]
MSSTTTSIASSSSTTTSSPTATCTTAVPAKWGNVPVDACNSNYSLDPNFAAAIAFTVLFGMAALGHTVQAFVYKKRFCWVIVVASLWDTASFALRALGAHDQQNDGYAIASEVLLLTAPLWINAFAYMVVGRMVYCFLPERKVYGIKAVWLAKSFVWLDIFSFILGMTIYRVGIAVQELFIILFLVLTQKFHSRMSQLDRAGQIPRRQRWRALIWTIYFVLALITMRIIYRFIEFSQGVSSSNPILAHEGYTFGLDALPMLLAAVLSNVVHPGIVLKSPEGEFPRLSRKEKKALKEEEKQAKEVTKNEKKMAKLAKLAKKRSKIGNAQTEK